MRPKRKHREKLTPREIEIIQLLADDYSMQGVAVVLGIAHTTARTHAQNALLALHVHSMRGAIARGFREGWLA